MLLPDIREVLDWALREDPARAGRSICRLAHGIRIRGGGRREVATWLEALLLQRTALPEDVLAEALADLGRYLDDDDLETAAALFCESIGLFARLGDRPRLAWATNYYAIALTVRGAYAEALELFERTLSDFRALDNRAMVADTLQLIGDALLRMGDVERGRAILHEAIATAESARRDSGYTLGTLADLELDQRRLNDAEALTIRSLDSARKSKDMHLATYCFARFASIAALRGDAEGAGEHWAQVEMIEEQIGDRLPGWDRNRYERILEPLTNDAAFRFGYEAKRVAATEAIGSLPPPVLLR